jgi:hypothetical protein
MPLRLSTWLRPCRSRIQPQHSQIGSSRAGMHHRCHIDEADVRWRLGHRALTLVAGAGAAPTSGLAARVRIRQTREATMASNDSRRNRKRGDPERGYSKRICRLSARRRFVRGRAQNVTPLPLRGLSQQKSCIPVRDGGSARRDPDGSDCCWGSGRGVKRGVWDGGRRFGVFTGGAGAGSGVGAGESRAPGPGAGRPVLDGRRG